MRLVFLIAFVQLQAGNLFSQNGLRVEVDGKISDVSDTIVLGSAYHDIRFLFPDDSGVVYKFRLEGLESDTLSSAYPVIRYTNLRGGTYTFFAEALRNQKPFGKYQSILEIKENFWEKWWFWIFVIFVVATGAGLLIYFWSLYDFRQRLKVLEVRQRIAADLHDEVGANLSGINFIIELVRKQLNGQAERVDPLLDKIRKNSHDSASLISDTIWALNPEYDGFESLTEKMQSFASGILAARDIAFDFRVLPQANVELTVSQRRDLYLIFKEAINNAAKHSEAGQLTVSITQSVGILEITISDNGIGFDTKVPANGNGIRNFQARTRGNNMTVDVQSAIGKGTTITVHTYLLNHQN